MNASAKTCHLTIRILALLGMAACGFCSCRGSHYPEPESITVGDISLNASAVLIYLAQKRGYFKSEGLRVSFREYETGAAAVDGLLNGETEFSWTAEFPVVRGAFEKKKISIIADIGNFSDQVLFGRMDRGIRTAADLRGKKIGLTRRTISEFFLGRYLEMNGVEGRDVALVDVRPQDLVEAVAAGKVDGILAWPPYSSRIVSKLVDRVVSLPVQGDQPGYGLIICGDDWVSLHPETVIRFLESLARAEDFIVRHPSEAKIFMQKWLHYDKTLTDEIWSQNRFFLSLDQSLVLAMEDEARWTMKNGIVPASEIPDFLDYIDFKPLEKVRPGAVTLIR